ncbi:MAG TPA: hypothetical protein VK503_08350 [Candidatus Bathyarchaeia archaeon]|nr:hypothetical protein [Candidatus Bathyarchaeia archaeon]
MSSKSRPTGVTVLAILEALGALYFLLIGSTEFFGTATIRSLTYLGIARSVFALIPRVIGTVLLIIGLVSIILACGLWIGKGWARIVALVFAVLGIIINLMSFHVIGIIIDAIIVYYLTRPNVKQFFTK